MLFNLIVPKESYQPLKKLKMTGVAWLSLVRVVKCKVNSGNERDPDCNKILQLKD